MPAAAKSCEVCPGALIDSTRIGSASVPTEPAAAMPWKRLTVAPTI